MPICVIPAAVQGDAAVSEIIAALELLNRHQAADVAILARGGGSLEDLAAFNSEAVARAIFASRIPVISAVGHETDYTIADFTADLRAPTPSAAAELAVPVKQDVRYTLQTLTRRLQGRIAGQLRELRQTAEKLTRRLIHPRRRMDDLRISLDEIHSRMIHSMDRIVTDRRERLCWRRDRLRALPLQTRLAALADRHAHADQRLKTAGAGIVQENRARLESLCGRMHALSPLAVLKRGYSITRTLPGKTVLTDAGLSSPGQKLEVILAKGMITCCVERIIENGKKNI
jgi:exodeoxyribonuclease VII large subunit